VLPPDGAAAETAYLTRQRHELEWGPRLSIYSVFSMQSHKISGIQVRRSFAQEPRMIGDRDASRRPARQGSGSRGRPTPPSDTWRSSCR